MLTLIQVDDDDEFDQYFDSDLIAQVDLSNIDVSSGESSTLRTQPQLSQPQFAMPDILPSRCLEDPWHVQHQLLKLLPQGHSAFKPFAAALSHAMFVHDKDDQKLVTAVLESKGETWENAL